VRQAQREETMMAKPSFPERTRSRKLGRPRKKKSPSVRDVSRNECNSDFKISVYQSSTLDSKAKEYTPELIPNHPKSNGLVRFKISERWFPSARSSRVSRKVPFIDYQGRIHSTSIGVWMCTSQQLLATITSTVFKRLRKVEMKKPKKKRTSLDLLFKISLLYSIELDTYWFTRCLELLKRNNSKALLSHYYRRLKVGSNKRFLFDQACKNALWLQSRALVPRVIPTPSQLAVSHQRSSGPKGVLMFSVTLQLNKELFNWGQVFLSSKEEVMSLKLPPYGKDFQIFQR